MMFRCLVQRSSATTSLYTHIDDSGTSGTWQSAGPTRKFGPVSLTRIPALRRREIPRLFHGVCRKILCDEMVGSGRCQKRAEEGSQDAMQRFNTLSVALRVLTSVVALGVSSPSEQE